MLRPPGRFLRAALATSALTALVMAPALAAAAGPVPTRFDIEPGSDVLISEVANGGAGASSQSNRDSAKNFIEITNYGAAPVDISGWRIFRCGQTGGGYGPQAVVDADTVLQPGEQYTAARQGSGYPADAYYGTSLHSFGFGAFIEDADGQRRDAIGFYHEDVATDCDNQGQWLQRGLQHRLDESHQRVANTGDIEADWVIAPRTVGAANVPAHDVARVDNGLRFSEFTNGSVGGSADQYIEITNYGQAAVDMSGYQLFRCGGNGTQYLQVGALPTGSVLDPGESYLAARSGGAYAAEADVTYGTSMHWLDFGVMLLTGGDEIVDSVGVYDNRNSPCTSGEPIREKLNHFDSTSYQRVQDTGNNVDDFVVTPTRTPGSHDPAADYAPAPEFTGFQSMRISEVVGAGPAGGDDEFFELGNYGDEPVNLAGWSAYRCYGTGQPGTGSSVQIADLGDVTVAPGQTYLGVPAAAPDTLLALADGTYATGLNGGDGYGIYITDADGQLVDAFASYDVNVNAYTPCPLGEEARNWTKFDEGESYTRAQFTGDNERDFVVTAERTPGVLADAEYVDPTVPLPGELDPVTVETTRMPGTPQVAAVDERTFSLTTEHQNATGLEFEARSAVVLDSDVVVREGVSAEAVPGSLALPGENVVEAAGQVAGSVEGYPFQRFEITTDEPVEFVWTGTASPRNELQLLHWTGSAWEQIDAAVPSADGDIALMAQVSAREGEAVADVMVIDGPRTSGGLHEEVGVHDQAFVDPGNYDLAINHMTDTQFLAEGFQDVFRQMTSWVVANADGRKIGYNTLTGDIIENWMNGNHSPERADREFQAAQDIMSLLNDAQVPNGVLPGNHDNMWGHNNDRYNEYFPVEMYQDQPWYGQAWAPGDNSAHTDYFSADGVDFLAISLPYRPSDEQLAWASEQAQAHPAHNVVLAVHSYLHTSGERDDIDRRYTATGADVWEQVLAPNENIFLVLGGHYHGVSTMYADPATGEQTDATVVGQDTVAVSNVGESGRTVIEMLADYQGYRSTRVDDPTVTRDDLLDRDTGFQRLLQLDLDAGLMAVNAYSPTLDTFEAWAYDEPAFRGSDARYDATDEEFVVAVDLIRSTTLASAGWAVTEPSTQITTADVAPSEAVEVSFESSSKDMLWYGRVVDGYGQSVSSAPQLLAADITDPTDPTDPSDPSDPSDPADPADPTGDPGDGSDPGNPDQGSGGVDADRPGLPITGAGVAGAALIAAVLLTVGLVLRRRSATTRL
ncbi:lamin tail domain-containing protein [Ruania alkalisoli]|uniref:Lamin tail domain-containing protein n=1 Tax=Ruania alkalisoli TaxID=2779775 RepID=A0A7M1SXG3_9MICO|nr:lamin tail domain-containing protein [Ruania alkalisoli]QOR72201.1 lamin tail domain-containing protein [Ruania alkalisoli]